MKKSSKISFDEEIAMKNATMGTILLDKFLDYSKTTKGRSTIANKAKISGLSFYEVRVDLEDNILYGFDLSGHHSNDMFDHYLKNINGDGSPQNQLTYWPRGSLLESGIDEERNVAYCIQKKH